MMPESRKDLDNKCWKRRTRLERKIIWGFSIVGILALIFLLAFIFRKSCKVGGIEEEQCTTKHCVQAAAQLLEFIDLKEDPCKDFYRFVCGNYYKNAVKRDSPSPWTSTGTLFKNEMKSLVVDPIRRKDSSAHIALKQFYHECMNETKVDEDGNGAFMEAIDELGGWPLINGTSWKADGFDWSDWYIKAKQMGLPVIGLFSFQRMETKKKGPVLKVTGPHLSFESFHSEYRFSKLMKKISEIYEISDNKQDHVDVHDFTEKIYNYGDALDPDDTDGNGSGPKIRNIQNLTDVCPDVPWLKMLNGLSGKSYQFNNASKITFDVDNMNQYCAMLTELLKKTNSKVIANYYIWSIIENSHIFMNKYIREAYQDVTKEGSDRFQLCFDAANERFKNVRDAVYIRKKVNRHVKPQILEMIEVLKQLYIEHLEKCEWMDESTKSTAVNKAKAIENLIGFTDEIYEEDEFDKVLGVDEFKFTTDNMFKMMQQKMVKENEHFFETVYKRLDDYKTLFELTMKVNAFFVTPLNLMIIPAPILTSIFFNRKFPAFMNYGAIGRTIGHEFMHGFSKKARFVVGPNGKFLNWWTDETADNYDNKVKCVIDEYESIPFKYKLNGTLTLEENVADYVGADIGYEAYQRYVKKYGAEKKLPGIPLTPDQIYWVQTSTHTCFRKLDDSRVDYEEEDDHAIPSFRVQAPARNSLHFANAFKCPVGSFMNPVEKCKIL